MSTFNQTVASFAFTALGFQIPESKAAVSSNLQAVWERELKQLHFWQLWNDDWGRTSAPGRDKPPNLQRREEEAMGELGLRNSETQVQGSRLVGVF